MSTRVRARGIPWWGAYPLATTPPSHPVLSSGTAPAMARAGSTVVSTSRRIPPGEMLFNFNNANIRAVIRTVAELTGKISWSIRGCRAK